jgi:hypothetical protein
VSPVKYKLGFYIPKDGISFKSNGNYLQLIRLISIWPATFAFKDFFLKNKDIGVVIRCSSAKARIFGATNRS